MGINERGINETINDTIDEAKCSACVSDHQSMSILHSQVEVSQGDSRK